MINIFSKEPSFHLCTSRFYNAFPIFESSQSNDKTLSKNRYLIKDMSKLFITIFLLALIQTSYC